MADVVSTMTLTASVPKVLLVYYRMGQTVRKRGIMNTSNYDLSGL